MGSEEGHIECKSTTHKTIQTMINDKNLASLYIICHAICKSGLDSFANGLLQIVDFHLESFNNTSRSANCRQALFGLKNDISAANTGYFYTKQVFLG
jgi:hypothetical protein